MRQNLKKNKIVAILAVVGICVALALGAGGLGDSGDLGAGLDSKRSLGEFGDSSDIWQWQNCDCEFKNAVDLNTLNKEQKVAYAMCGSPQMVVIKARDLSEAYAKYVAHAKDSALLESLPNGDKTYSAKNKAISKQLKTNAHNTYTYTFSADKKELKLHIQGVSNSVIYFFEKDGAVKIAKTIATF